MVIFKVNQANFEVHIVSISTFMVAFNQINYFIVAICFTMDIAIIISLTVTKEVDIN